MYTGELIDLTTVYDDQDVIHTEVQQVKNQVINTTVGRVILNDHLPGNLPYVNGILRKKGLQSLVQYGYLRFGLEQTVGHAGRHQGPGLPLRDPRRHLHRHRRPDHPRGEGRSWSTAAQKEVLDVEKQYLDGAITNGERYNKVIAIWSTVTEKVGGRHVQGDGEDGPGGREFNPIYIMADSGARGSSSRSASWPACAA
jgi:DNA-directed RNA polymerase subunit beta'